mmetsp:Transcript_145853/g.363668  ORF Transcript_145853/g.363668 Transcript_145853/m.363668 type:complete len:211 (+) Transcript_145853:305-937(+)
MRLLDSSRSCSTRLWNTCSAVSFFGFDSSGSSQSMLKVCSELSPHLGLGDGDVLTGLTQSADAAAPYNFSGAAMCTHQRLLAPPAKDLPSKILIVSSPFGKPSLTIPPAGFHSTLTSSVGRDPNRRCVGPPCKGTQSVVSTGSVLRIGTFSVPVLGTPPPAAAPCVEIEPSSSTRSLTVGHRRSVAQASTGFLRSTSSSSTCSFNLLRFA